MGAITIIAYILLWAGALGVVASIVFLGLSLAGALAHRRHCAELKEKWSKENPEASADTYQAMPVSVLKPIHGADPYLREDLVSFFTQDYPEYELLFAARTRDDAGLKIVDELAAEYPHVKTRVFEVGEPPFPNAKINSLARMVREAQHDILVMSDSDVLVERDHLREVTRVFADKNIGLTTCLYRGRHTHGFWSLMESLAFSVGMPSGVLTANLLEGMKFALGPTIVTRKQALDAIGGLLQFQDYAAEDFFIGNYIQAKGWRVELSHVVIDHNVPPEDAWTHWKHQARWSMMGRYCRPNGHLGTGLIFASPYGLMALAGGLLSGHTTLGLVLFGLSCLKGFVECIGVGWGIVRDPKALRYFWLYPLQDLLGFSAWLRSYMGKGRIMWRGDIFELQPGGKMVRSSG